MNNKNKKYSSKKGQNKKEEKILGEELVIKKPRTMMTISFQLMAINIVMAIAFLIVMVFIMTSMRNSTKSSNEMSDNVLSMSTKEAQLKSDVMALFDQVTGYATSDAEETRQALAPTIEQAKSDVTNDISELKSALGNMDDASVQDALTDIENENTQMQQLLDDVIATSDAGDTEKAQNVLFSGAEIQKVAIFHSCKAIDSAVAKSAKESNEYMQMLLRRGNVIAAVGMIVFLMMIILNYVLSYRNIIKKIRDMSAELTKMIGDIEHGRGDLTARIRTKTESELVLIKNGINHFIRTLQKVMQDVKDGTVVLTSASEEVTSQVRLANDNITSTSDAMEVLNASMSNVSDTVDSINSRVGDVQEAARDIASAAEDGTITSQAIKEEAAEIKEQVSGKKTDTVSKMDELSKVLEKSVEDSKKVERISALTDVILDIAEETNLLSLNASIEAARAGDAGKGFAIVASEISSLAANSRETAGNIQVISSEVTEAVEALSSNAKDVMEFINTTVLSDYDDFVDVGVRYEETAFIINDLLQRFMEKAEHMDAIMGTMSDAVDDIVNSVQESSEAINRSSENTTNMVGEIREINDAMDRNVEVTERLDKTTKRFSSL